MSTVIKCAICSERDGNLIKVTERGMTGMIDFSIKRNEDAIHQYLQNSQTNNLPVYVHEQCRKWFNNNKRINAVTSQTEMKKQGNQFNCPIGNSTASFVVHHVHMFVRILQERTGILHQHMKSDKTF